MKKWGVVDSALTISRKGLRMCTMGAGTWEGLSEAVTGMQRHGRVLRGSGLVMSGVEWGGMGKTLS